MCRIHYYILFSFLIFSISGKGQSLSYSGGNAFDISSPFFVDSSSLISHESNPMGMEFGDSGNKFYTIGASGDFVIQHNLLVAYDLSTISSIDRFLDVNPEDSAPRDVAFNDTGSKMYIVGDTNDAIFEYDLTTNWDVSTAILNDSFDFAAAVLAHEPSTTNYRPEGMVFNDDGTKLFVVDRQQDGVYEFTLTSAYDVSTASTNGVITEIDVASREANPRGLAFNNDGSEMYIIGNSGDEINIYTFTPGSEYTLSAASYDSLFSVSGFETAPQDLLFNNTGSKFYIIGSNGDVINELTLSMPFDFTSVVNLLGTYKILSFEKTPQDVLFNNNGTKMFVVGDTFNSIIQYSLSVPYDVSTSSLEDSYSINSEEANPRGMAFSNTGLNFYIVGTAGDEINEFSLSTAYDFTSTVTHIAAYDISTDDNNTTSITFNDDGTLLFILGNEAGTEAMPIPSPRNDVIVYTLSPAYDISDVLSGPTGRFSVSSQDSSPLGMIFNNDGTSLYLVGNQGNDINEYTVSPAYDLLTVTPTFIQNISIGSQDDLPTGIAFNNTGTKMFISGNRGDDINEYSFYDRYSEVSASNDGTIDVSSPLTITLTGDTFFASSGNFTDTEVLISGVPEGLTAVLSLNSSTEAQLTFTGKANSHINSDEILADIVFNFTDAAFTLSNATDVAFAVNYSGVTGFNFVECSDSEIVFNGSWTGGNNAGVPDDSATDLIKDIRVQGNITITDDTNCDCLHIENGQTLSVANGVELTVTNALELDGDIRLLGSAQLLQTHSGTKNASGTGNLYKDVKGTLNNVYQIGFWSSPVTTNGSTYTISGVLKDGTTALTASNTPPDILFVDVVDGNTSPVTLSRRWLYRFINASTWDTQVSETSDTFNPAEGFNKKSTGAVSGQNYTFVGQPNDGDYTSTIGPFGSGRWSLLGNPYPSPIDADTFLADNSTAIAGTLYFYEAGDDGSHNSSNYNGGYATRISGMGNPASDLGGIGTKEPDDNIAIGQGFFVEASATGGTVTFNNNQRVFDVSGASTEFFSKTAAKKKSSFPILRLGFEILLNDKVFHRPVAIGFRGATENYEWGFEAEMWDLNPTDLALQVLNKEEPFSIIGIQNFNNNLRIPITIQADEDRMISLMVDELKNIESTVFIYDSLIGVYYNITNDKATINLKQGTYKNRFFITFSENNTLSINKDDFDNISITSNQNYIKIQLKTAKIKNVTIYNTLGQEISNFTNSTNEISIEKNNYKKGLYLITILTEKGTFTKKIMIN